MRKKPKTQPSPNLLSKPAQRGPGLPLSLLRPVPPFPSAALRPKPQPRPARPHLRSVRPGAQHFNQPSAPLSRSQCAPPLTRGPRLARPVFPASPGRATARRDPRPGCSPAFRIGRGRQDPRRPLIGPHGSPCIPSTHAPPHTTLAAATVQPRRAAPLRRRGHAAPPHPRPPLAAPQLRQGPVTLLGTSALRLRHARARISTQSHPRR